MDWPEWLGLHRITYPKAKYINYLQNIQHFLKRKTETYGDLGDSIDACSKEIQWQWW